MLPEGLAEAAAWSGRVALLAIITLPTSELLEASERASAFNRQALQDVLARMEP